MKPTRPLEFVGYLLTYDVVMGESEEELFDTLQEAVDRKNEPNVGLNKKLYRVYREPIA